MITLLLPAQLLLCIHLSTWYSMSAPSLHSRTLPQKARGAERGGWGRGRQARRGFLRRPPQGSPPSLPLRRRPSEGALPPFPCRPRRKGGGGRRGSPPLRERRRLSIPFKGKYMSLSYFNNLSLVSQFLYTMGIFCKKKKK